MKPISKMSIDSTMVIFKRPAGAVLGQPSPTQNESMVSFPEPPQSNPTKKFLEQEVHNLSQLKGEDREWQLDQFMGLVTSKNSQELDEFKSLLLELIKSSDPSDKKSHRATMDLYNIVRHQINAQWHDSFRSETPSEGTAQQTVDLL